LLLCLLLRRFLLLDLSLVLHLNLLLDHLYRLLLNLLLSNGLIRSVILLGGHLLNHLLGLLLLDESLLGVRFGLSLKQSNRLGLPSLDGSFLEGLLLNLGLGHLNNLWLGNLFLSYHDRCRLLHRSCCRLACLLDLNGERSDVLLGGTDLDLLCRSSERTLDGVHRDFGRFSEFRSVFLNFRGCLSLNLDTRLCLNRCLL